MGFQPPPGYASHNPFQPPHAEAIAPYGGEYSEKTRATAFVLSYWLGIFGVDRFYVGHIWLGVLKLITVGGFGIWIVVDNILFALDVIKDSDGKKLRPPESVGQPTVNGSHVLLLSYFAGNFGIDRFMTGQIGLGILKLLTCGGCGIWWIVDVMLCAVGSMRDKDGNSLKWD